MCHKNDGLAFCFAKHSTNGRREIMTREIFQRKNSDHNCLTEFTIYADRAQFAVTNEWGFVGNSLIGRCGLVAKPPARLGLLIVHRPTINDSFSSDQHTKGESPKEIRKNDTPFLEWFHQMWFGFAFGVFPFRLKEISLRLCCLH